MKTPPIHILGEGVLIPLEYLANAHDFEFERTDGYVMVRPKTNGKAKAAVADSENDAPSPRFSWIGSMNFDNPNLSVEVEDILETEIDRRSGWTVKK